MRPMLVLALSLFAASPALADIQCWGTVSQLLIYSDGQVNIVASYRTQNTVICNLKTPRQGVDTFTCGLWVALIESARKANANVGVYYADPTGTLTCATIPLQNAAPAPTWLGR